MTGKRLVLGITIMGVAVPVILYLLLGLSRFNQLATISLVCMAGWAVAHLAGDILAMRRLGGRNNPVEALKQWEQQESEAAFASDRRENGEARDPGVAVVAGSEHS